MQTVLYHILSCLAYLLASLPWRATYALSDYLLYPLFRHIFRYRVRMVRRNIAASFPDRDEAWVRATTDRFYHSLCDLTFEAFKLLTISEEEMRRRMRFENIALVQQCADRGQDVVLYLGHMGNWEWVSSIILWLKLNGVGGQIYHPIENAATDRLFLKMRSRWRGVNITMGETLRKLLQYRRDGKSWVIGFIADQSPINSAVGEWLTFLHHNDTPVFTGAEKIGHRFGAAAFYINMRRESRGHYVGRCEPLCEDMGGTDEPAVTHKYFDALERNIAAQPHIWLWSHNRWKRGRKEYADWKRQQETRKEEYAARQRAEAEKRMSCDAWKSLITGLLLSYASMMLCRMAFVFENWSMFADGFHRLRLEDLLKGSLLFDTSAICYTGMLWMVMLLLPLHHKERPWWHRATRWVYVLTASLCVVLNLCDTVYFRYTGRRTTATVFGEFAAEDNLWSVFSAELVSHWYLVLLGIVLICLLWRLYRTPSMERDGLASSRKSLIRYYICQSVCLLMVAAYVVIGIRGGAATAVRPITVSNAHQYVNTPVETGIVLNTPFSILRTIGKDVYHVPAFFTSSESLSQVYSPLHDPASERELSSYKEENTGNVPPSPNAGGPSRKRNVVLLIVESLGREYIGALNGTATGASFPSYTPFVDSLCAESLTFDYSFSNGRKSIDGMPSILSGIPMFVEPFVLTPSSMNRVGSIAAELKELGYRSAFFHGAQNGSMGFQAFARSVGIEEYVGRTEYDADPRFGGEADFDGTWAIWDEPFLQFFATRIGAMSEPFFTSVFTASSHHPFCVPEQYADTFRDTPGDTNEMHRCVRYTDFALRRFFEAASKQAWYHNTIFVLTSDHTNKVSHAPYSTALGVFASPIIIFDPSGEFPRGRRHAIAQHIDIMPTLLNYLGAKRPYIAFGKDLLATPDSLTWAVNYNSGTYQYLQDSLLLQWDGSARAIYNIRCDWMLRHNLLGHPRQADLERRLKAIVQSYMERMTEDKLTVQ